MGKTPAPPLVVKVGGSLAKSGRLKAALELLATTKRPVVIVPGGGAFADNVREKQRSLGLSDAAAHRIAMLAMRQMAETFVSMRSEFALAESISAIRATLQRNRTPVWLPLPMMDEDEIIAADWSTTSDSLAVRLAELLGGAPLALLKSVDVAPGSAEDLARVGVVDAAFPGHIARSRVEWRIYGPADERAFRTALEAREASGAPNC